MVLLVIFQSEGPTAATAKVTRLASFCKTHTFTSPIIQFIHKNVTTPQLTQQIGSFVHIPDEAGACRRQLFKQRVCIAVERHVLDAFSRGAAVGGAQTER